MTTTHAQAVPSVESVESVVCLGCGCTCDDITLRCEDGAIADVQHACTLGQSWFATANGEPHTAPAWIDGQPASYDEAIRVIVEQLTSARRPLITGLGTSPLDAQRQAIHLAELLGGVIDGATSHQSGPITLASQLVGKPTCTLGEVRNRADRVIGWGVNPVLTHPRLLERYTPGTPGSCSLIVVDSERHATAAIADSFVMIPPDSDFEILTALRALLRHQRVDEPLLEECGVTRTQLEALLDHMRQARYGVLFFGLRPTDSPATQQMTAAALFALTVELNRQTRFAAIPIRQPGNAVGLDQILTWTTGYPFGVDFSRGYPHANAGEFTTRELLSRQETDAVLFVGSVPMDLADWTTTIPTMTLSAVADPLLPVPRVRITTAPNALAGEGIIYRMDTVPLPLRRAQSSPFPDEASVLRRIRETVQAC